MQKTFVILGSLESQDHEQFKEIYLNDHKQQILKNSKVKRYVANVIEEPSDELINAGWGWGERDTAGIKAIDEIWCEEDYRSDLYADNDIVIGAYTVNEIVCRPCYPKWPVGERSHWIKRMGLLKCLEEQRPEDFFQYWHHIHGPKALKHHIGAGCYVQNHFSETLKAAPVAWNGAVSLCYWNADAFQYGHFSGPDSMAVIKEDASHFIGKFVALLAGEYVQR
jgi:hypothetical protein